MHLLHALKGTFWFDAQTCIYPTKGYGSKQHLTNEVSWDVLHLSDVSFESFEVCLEVGSKSESQEQTTWSLKLSIASWLLAQLVLADWGAFPFWYGHTSVCAVGSEGCALARGGISGRPRVDTGVRVGVCVCCLFLGNLPFLF